MAPVTTVRARGVVRIVRIVDQRLPRRIAHGRRIAVGVALLDRRDRSPDGVEPLAVPARDERIGGREICQREEPGCVAALAQVSRGDPPQRAVPQHRSGFDVEIGEIRLFGRALRAGERADLLDLVVIPRVSIAGQCRWWRSSKTRRAREREWIEVGHPRCRHRRERRRRGRISEERRGRAPGPNAGSADKRWRQRIRVRAAQRKNTRGDLLSDEDPGIAVETFVREVVEVRRVESCRLRGVDADEHVVRRRGNGSGAAALGPFTCELSRSRRDTARIADRWPARHRAPQPARARCRRCRWDRGVPADAACTVISFQSTTASARAGAAPPSSATNMSP